VHAVILAQGIPFLESIPWKTIAIPSIILGFAVALFDSITRYLYDRESRRLQRDNRDLLVLMRDDIVEIKDAVQDINETTLSNAGYMPYTVKSDKEPELPRIGRIGG
jgi:hypothetical protein